MDQRSPTQRQLYRAEEPPARQRTAFREGQLPVAVYGLGKMGLPLAAVFTDVTGNVIGADIDESVVAAIEDGQCPVDREPGLEEAIERAVESGALRATTDPREAAQSASVHVIIVPTLLDGTEPDLSALEAVSEAIGAELSSGDLVLVESTVPPGTCSNLVEPILADESGLAPDEFGLAFCPERTASGSALADIRGSYPKVVGGRDTESTRAARVVYGEVTDNDLVTVDGCTTAECVKIFEGLYRDVNIALANELARLADELPVDINEAIEAANTQPFCDIHRPGPGVGGHCIPFYPYFLTETTDTDLDLVARAREVNEGMPAYTAEILTGELQRSGRSLEDAGVALLGATYRPGVDETRASPAIELSSLLSERGADVYLVDPVCSDFEPFEGTPVTLDLLPTLDLDAVVLVTAHDEFDAVAWDQLQDVVVVDGRQALDDSIPHPVYTLGSGRENDAEGTRTER